MEEKRKIQQTKGIKDFWKFYTELKIKQGWEFHKGLTPSDSYISKGKDIITYTQMTSLCRSFFFKIANEIILGKKFRLDFGLGTIQIIRLAKDSVKANRNYYGKEFETQDIRIKYTNGNPERIKNIEKFEFRPARSDSKSGVNLGFQARVSKFITENPSILKVYNERKRVSKDNDLYDKV